MSEIKTGDDFKNIIICDLYRYYGDSSKSMFRKTYKNIPGFRFTYWMRKCRYYSSRSKISRPLFYYARWRYTRLKYKFGFDIEYSTEIGKGFYLGHWGGVVVHPNTVIGENCNISHQVTIGVDNNQGNDAVPVIGDNVYIAPGSKLFGKIVLGNGCVVGANSVANKDVPPGVTVAGVPAKVISEKNSAAYVRNIS